MAGIFAQQQHPYRPQALASELSSRKTPPFPQASITDWSSLRTSMKSQYPAQGSDHLSPPMAGRRALATPAGSSTPTSHLPRQVFSSSPDHPYPASTLAAVEAQRTRFFARQSGSSRRSSSRPTMTGSTSLPPKPSRPQRTHKDHALSSASSSSYRQSFFERCQRAMDTSRTSARGNKVMAFRTGADGATPGLFSDEVMDEDEDEELPPSSPPYYVEEHDGDEGGREEDDELTRRRIIAEYSRLKRIYELKGHLEIGWMDPDQLSWLEEEVRQQQERGEAEQAEGMLDPYWGANDQDLEQLWLDSRAASQQTSSGDVAMDEEDDGDGFDDPAWEEVLARMPV